MCKIAVAGTGYVGLSIATLLAQHNEVTAVDIVEGRVEMVNRRESPIQDEYIEKAAKELGFHARYTIDDMCSSCWKWQTMNPDGLAD